MDPLQKDVIECQLFQLLPANAAPKTFTLQDGMNLKIESMEEDHFFGLTADLERIGVLVQRSGDGSSAVIELNPEPSLVEAALEAWFEDRAVKPTALPSRGDSPMLAVYRRAIESELGADAPRSLEVSWVPAASGRNLQIDYAWQDKAHDERIAARLSRLFNENNVTWIPQQNFTHFLVRGFDEFGISGFT